jgi:hypothetical protein
MYNKSSSINTNARHSNPQQRLATIAIAAIVSAVTTLVHAESTPLRAPGAGPLTSPLTLNTDIRAIPKDQSALFASPSISVKQIEVKPTEFPPVGADQYKVGFECIIKVTPVQKDYSKYPRYTCFIDKPKTSAMNALEIVRVDSWPSADGITTKIVMIADKKSAKNPNPGRIRTAFQLMHEVTETNFKPVLKDFFYADGLLKK